MPSLVFSSSRLLVFLLATTPALGIAQSSERWWKDVERLSHDSMAGRQTGSREHRQTAEYVANAFRNRFGGHAGWAHQFLFEENVANGRARRKAASALPLR